MSEMYEGVVFRSDESSARTAFAAVVSPLRLRLVRLADGVFGAYRVAGRGDAFDRPALERVAHQISAQVGRVVALLYDNSSDVRVAVAYADGRREREFGEADARWVPYADSGELLTDGPRYRSDELQPGVEYDCIVSPIDAALEAVPSGPEVTGSLVRQVFCDRESGWLAESGG
jgi:hypothetical protein